MNMKQPITRRAAITLLGAAAVPAIIKPARAQSQRPAPLEPDLVLEFVGAAHFDLEKVKELLDEHPGLLNSTVDHGGGDFEAAIGGAGHMGRRDIAEYLIEKGAKTTLFVHAMLGDLDIVKASLTAHPRLLETKGPHGISLLRHAEKGGEHATEVLDYLNSLKS